MLTKKELENKNKKGIRKGKCSGIAGSGGSCL
jgi:hypothetical protein